MKFFKPAKYITREDGATYLIRWNLFECKLFSIKIHKLILSDYDCLHDHPWPFITFLMKGGYVEYYQKDTKFVGEIGDKHIEFNKVVVHSKVRSRFSLLYRPSNFTHRLEIHQPVWTFVITFKKVRQWGFYTKNGWIPWFHYHSTQSCE